LLNSNSPLSVYITYGASIELPLPEETKIPKILNQPLISVP